MHDGATVHVVWILALALVSGAATRAISRRTRLPYTIALLLVGLGAGLLIRWVASRGIATGLVNLVVDGQVLSPELILFVFLPALVFESAFSLDSYAFRKELGTISLLAVPALVASTLLTAVWMVGVTASSWQWGWTGALVFGALVSATDPVAVVALLREVGAPKRLGVLIEGESLLNDGTAIVLFGVLLQFLVFAGSRPGIDSVAMSFLSVVAGGVVVGLGVAALLSVWIARTFNDPMVEITLTLVMAYAAMMIAEGLLHVSGVIAVVAAGLWMSGLGKTHISPEVAGFLRRFWELLSYLANTIIFLLVGIVIAVQIGTATLNTFLVIGASYVGLVFIRFAVMLAFRPLIGLVGDALTTGEAAVMAWSGLRGAVSLALALAINQNRAAPRELREQLLVATAGIVLLTLLVNGGTIRWLLHRLGYDRRPLEEARAQHASELGVLADVTERIHALQLRDELTTLPWSEVESELERREGELDDKLGGVETEAGRPAEDPTTDLWRRALQVERKSYWDAYNRGVLGSRALRILTHEIDVQRDRLQHGSVEPPERRTPALSPFFSWLARLGRRAGLRSGPLERRRLSLVYDLSSAENRAARNVLRQLGRLRGEPHETREAVERTYRRYAFAAKESIEELRSNLPEVTRTIETRLARRIALNYEREAVEELDAAGVLDARSVGSLLAAVERRMKVLWQERGTVRLPDFHELCVALPFFRGLDPPTLDAMASLSREQVLAPGETLFEQGDRGDSLYVIARGAAYILREARGRPAELYGVLGGGEIVGEMALLTGERRSATVRAATTLTLFRIGRDDFRALLGSRPYLQDAIWQSYSEHAFDTLARERSELAWMDRDARLRWLAAGERIHLTRGDRVEGEKESHWFLVQGELSVGSGRREAPALFEVPTDEEAARVESLEAVIVRLPRQATESSGAGTLDVAG